MVSREPPGNLDGTQEFHENVSFDELYTEDELTNKYGIPRVDVDLKTRVSNLAKRHLSCSYERFIRTVTSIIPIISWLPQYKIKECLLGDIVAGFTVAIVHLPQGMAYGMLASLPPVIGLYVSFFPVLIYALLGTVRQVSIGTFAVICIMIGEVVDEHVPEPSCASSTAAPTMDPTTHDASWTTMSSETDSCQEAYLQRKIAIAVALSLAVGIIQIAMSLLRLGIVTVYLSEHLVSGFTCGSAFHVLTSQITKLIGISVQKYSGPLSLVYTYIDIFSSLAAINWATVIVSTICIVFLLIGKEINQRFHDKIPIPIPWEFAVVIFSTLASYYGLFYDHYDIIVVGDIPTGLKLTVPESSDIGAVMVEAIPIAIVVYAIEVSLGKMFAMKHSYKMDSNQELLALGSANVFSSFFSCFPCAASLSRSVIWDEVGGKTQITGLVSSALILTIILWIGPLFESLPQAALGAIIVVNLKRLLRQFEKVGPYWRVCKLDAVTWVVTWVAVVLLGVDIGLLVGLAFEIATVVCNTQVSDGHVLGEIQGTKSYKNVKSYRTRQETDKNIVIYSHTGPLYFANHDRFRNQLSDAIGFDPLREAMVIKSMDVTDEETKKATKKTAETEMAECGVQNEAFTKDKSEAETDGAPGEDIFCSGKEASSSDGETIIYAFGVTFVILDMSSCSFIDNDGVNTIKLIFSSLRQLDIKLVLASCTDSTRKALETVCSDASPPFFLSLEGAVRYARGEIPLELDSMGKVKDSDIVEKRTSL